MASTRRRVSLRFVPPRSSHSWASSGVMVTVSRFRSGPRVGDGSLPLGCALARVRVVRGLVGLRVVGTEGLLSLRSYTVPERREDAERWCAMRWLWGPFLSADPPIIVLKVWMPEERLTSRSLTLRSRSLPLKILRKLLGRFPAWNLNPIALAICVRTKT